MESIYKITHISAAFYPRLLNVFPILRLVTIVFIRVIVGISLIICIRFFYRFSVCFINIHEYVNKLICMNELWIKILCLCLMRYQDKLSRTINR